jgi:hypothetical protein
MDVLNDGDGRPRALTLVERDAIVNALAHTRWCAARAATLLGIGRSTLYRKMAEYAIARPEDLPMPAPIAVVPSDLPTAGPVRRFAPGTFGSPEANAALAEMLMAERRGVTA